MSEIANIRILIAPLDWGLGHATRCIPLIQYLLNKGCTVFIGAEGFQKGLLEKEFPAVKILALKGYRINYSRNKRLFALKIIQQLPVIIHTISTEHKWLDAIVTQYSLDAVISDNRYGLYHSKIPSIFMTHQLKVKAHYSLLENLLQFLNYRYINRFSACWVPDFKGSLNIAGSLSNVPNLPSIPVEYLGGLSRFEGDSTKSEYDFIAIISGPEPQRSIFEGKILREVKNYTGRGMIVRGLPGNDESVEFINAVKIVGHLPARELEAAFKRSEVVISRSGYTTVMDIIKLRKKSILIPTPGQTEQEYLAAHLNEQNLALAIPQQDFQLVAALRQAKNYNFRLPALNMEMYKEVLDGFLISLQNR